MDPNETLRLIRLYIKQMQVEDRPVGNQNARLEFVQHARDLAETVEGLDEWLTKGGFLPDNWRSDDEKNVMSCGCGQPIVWIEDDPAAAIGHWEHDVAEAYWGGDHDIDEPAPEGWN